MLYITPDIPAHVLPLTGMWVLVKAFVSIGFNRVLAPLFTNTIITQLQIHKLHMFIITDVSNRSK